jgi:hypothetical protein
MAATTLMLSRNCHFQKGVVVFSNSGTKVTNRFTAIGAARGAARPCLPNQTV